jgi:hypothetical protein
MNQWLYISMYIAQTLLLAADYAHVIMDRFPIPCYE